MTDTPSSLPTESVDQPDTRVLGDASATPMTSPAGELVLEEGTLLTARYTYKLKEPIGRGGFGSVWIGECLDKTPGAPTEPVAVKIFITPQGFDVEEILNRELSALLAVKHERIPRIYDWGRQEKLGFVVMRYCAQGSLHNLRTRLGRLDADTTWTLLRQLLSVLNAAHRANVLHLDIKPANVLLDDSGGFLLTDFGIAQGNFVSWDVVRPALGTVGYQAPEQRAMKEKWIGGQTDLYGVGATVWSVYTGIELSTKNLLQYGTPEEDPASLPPMRTIRPETPEALDDIVMSLLMRDPAKRPGGAAEVLARITELLNMTPSPNSMLMARRVTRADSTEVHELVSSLIDPLYVNLFRECGEEQKFVRFLNGDYLCREGEMSHTAFLLLKGEVIIERDGNEVARETREGSFLGEVSTLTGLPRTAGMKAAGTVWACLYNAGELERLVMNCPAIGIRLIKSLAERVADNATLHRPRPQDSA